MVEWYGWVGFLGAIAALFAFDLGLFHRRSHVVRFPEALLWSGLWVALGLGFALVLWAWRGGELATEYLAGYVIEWSLSVDNIFVFVMLFLGFGVPQRLRQRVLMWGVVGAVVLRLGFILGGAALLHAFAWMEYVFGAILLMTAVRFLVRRETARSVRESPVVRVLRRVVRVTDDYKGERYIVRDGAGLSVTPLLVVLVLITVSDVIFAVDSIPAVFAVTQNAFVAFSSNALAVLGLRPLFFVLAGAVERFHYLNISLAAVLGFVGLKLILHRVVTIPTGFSLGIIAALLAAGLLGSWIHGRVLRDRVRGA
jgi:TerC family integral membrane protein